jgi:CRISPR/Cas system CSM-associated protein Csm3 (group 7 of RAMP superfamily)
MRAAFESILPEISVLADKYGNKSKRDEIKKNRVVSVRTQSNANESENDVIRKISDDEYLAQVIYQDATWSEKLFGSTLMEGKVKISDAVLKGDNVKTEIRKSNAIDRDTHTAVGNALFDTEVIPAGTEFVFRLSAENLT